MWSDWSRPENDFVYDDDVGCYRQKDVFQMWSWDGWTKHGLTTFLSSIWKTCKYSPHYLF